MGKSQTLNIQWNKKAIWTCLRYKKETKLHNCKHFNLSFYNGIHSPCANIFRRLLFCLFCFASFFLCSFLDERQNRSKSFSPGLNTTNQNQHWSTIGGYKSSFFPLFVSLETVFLEHGKNEYEWMRMTRTYRNWTLLIGTKPRRHLINSDRLLLSWLVFYKMMSWLHTLRGNLMKIPLLSVRRRRIWNSGIGLPKQCNEWNGLACAGEGLAESSLLLLLVDLWIPPTKFNKRQ